MANGLPPWLLHWPVWLAVTVCLGGPAAFASGRAVALGWRGISTGLVHGAFISAAASFLAYALFGVPVIPVGPIISSLSQGDLATATSLCSGWLASFIFLSCVTIGSWQQTRRRQMLKQYPFLDPGRGR